MKEVKKYIAIIGTFFLCAFLYEKCHKQDKYLLDYNMVKEIHDTVYQQKTITKYKKGEEIPVYIISNDSVQIPVHDTVQILTEFYQVKAYNDTIKKDSNIFVIHDTISQNKIISRGFQAHLTEKTIITKQFYVEKPKYSFFWGFRGDFSKDNELVTLSPSLMLNAKNKALIGLSLNINKNYNIGYSGGVYFKIGKK